MAGAHGYDLRGLVDALNESGYEVEYHTLRRFWSGDQVKELERSLARAIANVLDASMEYVSGDANAEPPAYFVKGAYRGSPVQALAA
jgi:hypothetical protein